MLPIPFNIIIIVFTPSNREHKVHHGRDPGKTPAAYRSSSRKRPSLLVGGVSSGRIARRSHSLGADRRPFSPRLRQTKSCSGGLGEKTARRLNQLSTSCRSSWQKSLDGLSHSRAHPARRAGAGRERDGDRF